MRYERCPQKRNVRSEYTYRKHMIINHVMCFFSAQLMGGGVFVVFVGLAVRPDLPHFLFGFI